MTVDNLHQDWSRVDTHAGMRVLPPLPDPVNDWLPVVSDVIKLANVLCDTEFVPETYRGRPPAVAAAILTGRELGLGPMQSLRHVQIVKGTPVLSAEYKRARVLAAGHEFEIIEAGTTRCVVSGRRAGSAKPPHVVQFTMDDARKANLVRDRSPWQTRPRRMLLARASSELCDFLFADVTNGLPTAELVEVDAGDDAPVAAPPARRTARRQAKPAAPVVPVTIVADEAVHAVRGDDTAITDVHLPPLPGEDEPERKPRPKEKTKAAEPVEPQQGYDPDDDPMVAAVTRPQLGKIAQLFRDLGYTDDQRAERLKVASKITGRVLATSQDLRRDEAKALIDTIASCDSDHARLDLLMADIPDPEDT